MSDSETLVFLPLSGELVAVSLSSILSDGDFFCKIL